MEDKYNYIEVENIPIESDNWFNKEKDECDDKEEKDNKEN